MKASRTYLFGRSRLARLLLAAGYALTEAENPYNDYKNWQCDLNQPGAAELIYRFLMENGYTVPPIICEALKNETV